MKNFMTDNFLLQNKIAERLYHEVAGNLPVIDYHNHLKPGNLAENKLHDNIAGLWLINDQYKHRAMRINGIPEQYITGNASDKEKFMKWCGTFPNTIGNPLYHWSMMEMKKFFGIQQPLTPHNAGSIWDECNKKIQDEQLGEMDILSRWNVEILCTSDDLLENITQHAKASQNKFGITVKPSLRGDSILNVENDNFMSWLNDLSAKSNIPVNNLDDYLSAVKNRLDDFDNKGCKVSDHAIDAGFEFVDPQHINPEKIFAKKINGQSINKHELAQIQSWLLQFLSIEYTKRNWFMQLHIGAQRFTSSRLRALAGSAGGYACIGKSIDMENLCFMLDTFENNNGLPKTILFNLNPSDNQMLASVTGSFAQNNVPGKIQFGPAWWYNDHWDGIEKQFVTLANFSLLNRFIGMTTDSRSVLSFSRHEYFRRVICNIIGKWVGKGYLPDDFSILSELIRNISYQNSKNWINN
jgi:glucuronate isomerase